MLRRDPYYNPVTPKDGEYHHGIHLKRLFT